MKEFKPPSPIQHSSENVSIFLAGTIDMGKSYDWQSFIKNHFLNKKVDFYNPRRDSWDKSWTQEYENPQFFQQVMWELDALESADHIIFNFLPESKSPISLLELGLHARSGKLKVCCPKEFYRNGNVEIVCNKYKIPLYRDLDSLLEGFNTIPYELPF